MRSTLAQVDVMIVQRLPKPCCSMLQRMHQQKHCGQWPGNKNSSLHGEHSAPICQQSQRIAQGFRSQVDSVHQGCVQHFRSCVVNLVLSSSVAIQKCTARLDQCNP